MSISHTPKTPNDTPDVSSILRATGKQEMKVMEMR